MYCLITNDVETTSILHHQLRDETGRVVLEQGMPRLLDLYERYGVKATFFFTGHIARLYPEVVRMAQARGHEVGSHGLTHEVAKAFDVLSRDEQLQHLRESKKILEDITGEAVVSFRAPAARVGKEIPALLREAGYEIDSSVASQRLDMFFSFGSWNKLHWLTAPRHAYFAQDDNIFRRSEKPEGLFEIPISAFGFPYIGTFMRIAPGLNRLTRRLLYAESRCNDRQFVFLTHPNEFIDEEQVIDHSVQRSSLQAAFHVERRAKNFVGYLLGDVLRHQLKVKNLGAAGLPLLERELQFFEKKEIPFLTCKELKDKSD